MEDPSFNISGCILSYDDYKSAAVHWKRACDTIDIEKPSDFDYLCQNVARGLAGPFPDGTYEKILRHICKPGFDFVKDLPPVIGPLKTEKAAQDEKRRQQEEERERLRHEEEKSREERIKKLREQRLKEMEERREVERKEAERIREKRRLEEEERAKAEEERWILKETRRKHQKEMAELLKRIECSAAEGVFEIDVPPHLATVLAGAYDRALRAGAKIYFKRIIENGDLPSYDAVSKSAPGCLQEVSKKIKAHHVSDAIEHATNIRLDEEQLDAVLADDKVMKVTARAGSGKTRVLVAKAFYLIKFYNVNPNAILLLAFNKNAAREIEDRLKSFLDLDAFHTARTFHSLAYQIAKPESELVMSDVDPAMDQVGKIIQEILRGIWNDEIAESIYTFFRKEAREYEGLGLHLSGKKFYDYRRSLPQSTLRGDVVRSMGEKYIADYLFEHGIGYLYEPSFRMGSAGIYRPDFGIWVGEGASKRRFVWEHWAFNPSAPSPGHIDGWSPQEIEQYKEDIQRKRDYWSEKDWELIETHSDMLSEGRAPFEAELRLRLENHGIKHEKLSQAELLQRVEHNLRSKLSRLLSQFVSRSLSSECNISVLFDKLTAHNAEDDREEFFLRLGSDVLNKYLKYLDENQLMDFALFFAEASQVLEEAGTIPLIHASGGNMINLNSLEYIFVDEAQDLSPNYLLLLDSLKKLLPQSKLMFVGDDWQAINRFAGANVDLFIDLKAHYNGASGYAIKNNYRSRKGIVEAGNLLMSGNPIEHARATKLGIAEIQSADIDSVWLEFRKGEFYEADRRADRKFLWGKDPEERRKNDPGDEKARLVKAVFSICKPMISGTGNLAVLFRSNRFKGSFIDKIRDKVLSSFYQEGFPRNQIENLGRRLEFITVHRSKGKEYDTILVVSPHVGSFPMIHSDAQLFRFFGDSLEQALEDEMRLFYVAITRAERRLIFLREASKISESPFLESLEDLINKISLR
jgi:DNA helicase-4